MEIRRFLIGFAIFIALLPSVSSAWSVCSKNIAGSPTGSDSTGLGSSNSSLGQPFTLTTQCTATQVMVSIAGNGNSNTAQLIIEADNGSGAPSGTSLATMTVSGLALSTYPTFTTETYSISTSSQPVLAAGNYWLVFSYSLSGARYWQYQSAGAFGNYATKSGSTWTSTSTADALSFEVDGIIPAPPTPSVIPSPTSTQETVSYHDWLFVNATEIFLLALMAMGIVVAPLVDIMKRP